ncbi:MAG: IPT/TIG domain-containing protein, partial [Ilumatobacteraceae bacterium]
PTTPGADGRFSVTVDNLDEGTYRVYATQTDDPGNLGQSAVHEFTVDRTDPTVSISAATFVQYQSNDLWPSSLSFETSPDTVSVTCFLNGTPQPNCTSPVSTWGNYFYFWDVQGGTNVMSIVATDAAGNVGSSDYYWYIDDIAPDLSVTSPAQGLVSSENVLTVSGVAGTQYTDVLSLEIRPYSVTNPFIYVPMIPVTANSSTGQFSAVLPALQDGVWEIEVAQRDWAGNVAFVTQVITIDTSAPTVTLTNGPTNGSITALSSTTIEYTTTGLDIVSTTCTLDGVTLTGCTSPRNVSGIADGLHTFTITVADAAGNSDTETVSWTVDTTAPSVAITSPADGTVLGVNSITVTGTAGTATNDDDEVQVALTGPTNSTLPAVVQPNGTFTVTFTGLGQGAYTVAASQGDTVSNDTTTGAVDITIDTLVPTVSITQPTTPTSSTQASIVFAASGTGTAVTTYCDLDGYGFTPCTSPKQYFGLASGQHVLTVKAYDAAGNTATDSVTWMVDATAPAPFITAPVTGTALKSTTVTVSGTAGTVAGDDLTLTLAVYSGSSATGTPTASTVTATSGAWSAPITVPSAGTYTVRVEQSDNAGNTGFSNTVTFTVDVTAPSVNVTSPTSPTRLTSASVAFTATDGGSGIATVECSLDGGTFTVCTSPASLSGLGAGSHTLVVRATDRAGNTSTGSATWTIDLTAPVVTLLAPADGSSTSNTSPAIIGTTTDSGTVTITIHEGTDTSGIVVDTLSPAASDGAFLVDASLAEGTYTAVATQNDTVGNTGTSNSVTFTVDETAPAVTITDPATPTNSTSASIAFTVAESGAGIALTECSLDGLGFTACGSSPKLISGLASGSHTLTIRSTDKAGNVGTDSTTWVVDTVAPAVTITSPSSGTLQNTGTVTVSGTASESSNVTVTFTGQSPRTNVTVSSGTWTTTYSGLGSGTYTITATQTDLAGNATTTSPVTVTIDTVAPVVAISAGQADGSVSNTASATFEFATTTVTPDLAGYLCDVDGAGYASCTSPATLTGLADGTHTFRVVAVDRAGNRSAADSRTWSIDTTTPVLALTSPVASSATTDTTPTLAGTSSEAGTVTVTVYAGIGTGGSTVQTRTAPVTSGAFTVDATALLEGTYTAVASLTDAAGNAGVSPAVTFTVDTTAPTVSILTNPLNPTTATGGTFTFNPADGGSGLASVQCKLDGANFAPCDATGSQAFSGLADGSHTFSVRAVDRAGNTSTVATYTWRIDTTAPVVSLTNPANGSFTNDTTPAITCVAGVALGDNSTVTINVYAGPAVAGTPIETISNVTVTAGTGGFSANAGTLGVGQYTVQVTQADSLGNSVPSAAHTFIVDLTAPVIALSSPVTNTATVDTTPTVSGTAGIVSGDFSTVNVKVYSGSTATGTPVQSQVTTRSNANGAYTVDLATLARGTYTIVSEQRDAAGNIGTSSSTTIRVANVPTVTLFDPLTGPAGTSVLITGLDFTFATAVAFNGTSAQFTVVNDTSITTTVPVGATNGPISVTTGAGTGTSTTNFIVGLPAPTIASFTPTSGGIGTSVTILGDNFQPDSQVRFNGALAGNVTVVSLTEITAVVPAGTTTGPISVTTTSGTGTSAANFTFVPPPTVTTFTPLSGIIGSTVTVNGSNLTGASVRFNGTLAVTVTVANNGNSLTAVVPAGATTGQISVTTTGGTATSTASFVVLPAVNSLSPATGPVTGSTTVLINGTGFTGVSGVTFGGIAAISFEVVNSTQISAVSPATVTVGVANVQVTTVSGSSSTAVTGDNYTYTAVTPSVTSIAPISGTTAGGTPVTIVGSGFITGATVRFGATAATNVVVVNPTQITAVTPATTTPGTVSVTVVTSGGTSNGVNFTYSAPAPTITSIAPTSGTTAGGTTVTITGTGFVAGASVSFGTLPATNVTVVSNTSITAVSPASSTAGPVSVSVTTSGGTSNGATFTYTAPTPTVTALTPATGSTIGGTTVQVTGTGFLANSTVAFGTVTVPAGNVTVNSQTSITVISPAVLVAGVVNVTVTTSGGTSATGGQGDNFTYTAPIPAVTSLSPTSGTTAGGTLVTINGTGFLSGATVRFGATAATGVVVVSPTQITANSPATLTAGVVSVSVTTAGGTSSTAATSDDYTYVAPTPTITAIAPTSGPTAGGTSVTITGTGFVNGATVTFGANTSATVTVASATSITAVAPASLTAGPVTVSVTTTGGSATSPTNYTYNATAPTVTTFSPTSGGIGFTLVTITGTNFLNGSTVRFGNSAFVPAQVISATQLRVTVPTGATTGPISVQTVNGLLGTSRSNFTVVARPVLSTMSPISGLVGTTVTITGTNLLGATVQFGTLNVTPTINRTGTSLTFAVPTVTAGGYVVSVRTAGGISANTPTFTVTAAARLQPASTGSVLTTFVS